MRNYSIALLNLMMGFCLFLYGYAAVADTDVEKTNVSVSAEQDQTENKTLAGRKNLPVAKEAPVPDADNADQATKLPKPLDLSIPFEVGENAGQKSKSNAASQDLFSTKKQRTLELSGSAVMTQEVEGEKQPSVDGAGIVLNLKAP
jgi:hypothetical protein